MRQSLLTFSNQQREDEMKTMNKQEQYAMAKLFARQRGVTQPHPGLFREYRAFRRTARYTHMGCWLVPWCGMIVGIERDGYTHT